MTALKKKFYFFYLEIALKSSTDSKIYAFENISHIPTKKLVEIFEINLHKDPYLIEGYFLTKSKYKKHKEYINKNVGNINFNLFEYTLRQYTSNDYQSIRNLFKEDLME